MAVVNGGPIQVLKQAIPASVMVDSRAFREMIRETLHAKNGTSTSRTLIGHSRLVTNGAQENNSNNQPVIADGMVAIHNGIITNDALLWKRFPALRREYEIDTEVLLKLIRMYAAEGRSLTDAVRAAFRDIQGYASVAVLFDDQNDLLLATNNGSLYWVRSSASKMVVFASEEFILRTLIERRDLRAMFAGETVERIQPGHASWVGLDSLDSRPFMLGMDNEDATCDLPGPRIIGRRDIVDRSAQYDAEFAGKRIRVFMPVIFSPGDNACLLTQHLDAVKRLKRCTRCVLPETYPFIRFDEHGICSQCRNPRKFVPKGHDALAAEMDKVRRSDGKPDCLVAVSGGRDSIYGLHYMKTVLGMNPIAYTYDWGMVTDLARRNISRICGKLGVEHILVSADINRKRDNIRRNISAWLKRPDMGVIPLFMAGDKTFFYYAKKVQDQVGVGQVIWCSGSWLEGADFKWSFCGVHRDRDIEAKRADASNSGLGFKLRLLMYYGKQFLLNPSYLNSTLIDTMFGFYSYYMLPRDFTYLYSYLPWNEETIIDTLVKEYDWELSGDTKQTWRIGDGTASFYNYIYHCVAGFSENDTFRSEQVRRGMVTREQALEHVTYENIPRYESIKWYLSIIGLGDEFNRVISIINSIPKHYPA